MPTPGEEREFRVIDHLSVRATWDGTRNPVRSETSRANPANGWVVLETRVETHNSNNGWASTDVLVGGATIVSSREIQEFYQQAIDAAYRDGKRDMAARLENKRDYHLKKYEYTYTNRNLVQATVNAQGHGHVADRKRGWHEISVHAKCMYLGLPDTLDA